MKKEYKMPLMEVMKIEQVRLAGSPQEHNEEGGNQQFAPRQRGAWNEDDDEEDEEDW
jgi:hypothetical protein